MKKLYTFAIALIAAVVCLFVMPTEAQAATEGYYTYEVSDGEAIITDCDTSISGDVVLPSTLGGYPVTSIGDYAFYWCESLTSVTVGDSVASIGDWAFVDCTSLTSVTIGDSVTSIGSAAFRGCSSLTSITIPDGVTYIGDSAFSDCSGLASITIPDSVTEIYWYTFENCIGLTSITIPDSVTSISSNAFAGCIGLTSITIPDSVISINEGAFQGCSIKELIVADGSKSLKTTMVVCASTLEEIVIPDSVTDIDSWAFSDCSKLSGIWVSEKNASYSCDSAGVLFNKDKTELIQVPGATMGRYVVPDSVTCLGDLAFYRCTGLTSITIPDSVTDIGWHAFSGCTGLTSITIPDSVTSLGLATFSDCTGLTSIIIPESITDIGTAVFSDCTSLTSITIPDSVTYIGESAFSGCTGLASVTIGDSVTSMGNYAFFGCTGLTSIRIGESVTSIASDTFSGCIGLTSITIPDGVTSIGAGAFEGCTSLTSITIPDGVTYIGGRAFFGCTNLTDVTFGAKSQLTDIGWYAFYNCSNLTNITIPDGVTSIDWDAFAGCNKLTGIWVSEKNICYSCDSAGVLFNKDKTKLVQAPGAIAGSYVIPGSVTSIGRDAFSGCAGLISITIPDSVDGIDEGAFQGCTSLTSITIPDSVTSLTNWVFYNCAGLTSITIPDSVTSIGIHVFSGCSKLTGIWVSEKNISYSCDDAGVLFNKDKTKLIQAPGAITRTYVVPDSVITIDNYAFNSCTSLTNITIPDGVTSIGAGAFEGCTGLASITIPESMASIGNSAFYACVSLTDVYYSGSFKQWTAINIGFDLNEPLLDATIHYGKSVSATDYLTFQLNENGESYSVTACDYDARGDFTIPSTYNGKPVISIGDDAFLGCTGLTSITIPDSVTSIGYDAFSYCPNLTDVYYSGTEEEWVKITVSEGNDALLNATIHYVEKELTDPNMVFVGNYLSFQEYIGMQTMLQTKLVKDYTKVYVEAIQTPVGGVASEPVILEPIDLNSSYKVFDMKVMAWDMTDTITMTLYAEDAEGNVYKGATVSASVESLALEKLASLDGTNAAGCRVLVDMLNYGAAVQSAYGHNAANLPNTQIGDYAKYATTGEISIGGNVTSSGKATGVSDYGIYVSMQAQVELTMMIKPKTGYSIENMEMRVTPEGGETRTFDYTTFTPNGAYYIPTVALKAADFRTPHTLAIYDKTTGKVLSKVHLATVEAKAAASLGTDYETVVVNMMKYGDAVAAMVAG